LESFRIKLPTLWRQASAGMLVGALTSSGLQWAQGNPFNWPDTLPMTLAAAVAAVVSYLLQPTLAGPEGLHVMNSWGLRRRLGWADVEHAALARQHGLWPSFKLLDAQGRAYWISRDTLGLEQLHHLALQHGGTTHPLVRVLRTPLYAA
jgi:hypothetical protein